MTVENTNPIQVELESIMTFGAYFNWSQVGCGFGQLAISVEQQDGDITIISGSPEGKNHEWMRQALHALVDKIIDSVPPDADRYNIDVTIPHPPSEDLDGTAPRMAIL